jgi:hypothetical protein
MAYLVDKLVGQGGMSYAEALELVRAQADEDSRQAPVMTGATELAGSMIPGSLFGPGIKAAALGGGSLAATNAASDGRNPVTAAAGGAALGALGQRGADALRVLADKARSAMMLRAAKKEWPDPQGTVDLANALEKKLTLDFPGGQQIKKELLQHDVNNAIARELELPQVPLEKAELTGEGAKWLASRPNGTRSEELARAHAVANYERYVKGSSMSPRDTAENFARNVAPEHGGVAIQLVDNDEVRRHLMKALRGVQTEQVLPVGATLGGRYE